MTIQVILPSTCLLGSPPYIFCLLPKGRWEVSQDCWGGQGLGQEVRDSWGLGGGTAAQGSQYTHSVQASPFIKLLCLWCLIFASGTLASSSQGLLRIEFILLYNGVR